jgi:hypothetical protein
MATTSEQGIIPKGPTYRSPTRHMLCCSPGMDMAAVVLLAVSELQYDPGDPFETAFDVINLQALHGLTLPQVVQNVVLTTQRPPVPGSEWRLIVDETVIPGAVWDSFKGKFDKTPTAADVTSIGQQALLSKLVTTLHRGELKIAKDLTEAPALIAVIKEAPSYATGPVDLLNYNHMLFATALAVWHADKWWRGNLGRSPPRVIHQYAHHKGFSS